MGIIKAINFDVNDDEFINNTKVSLSMIANRSIPINASKNKILGKLSIQIDLMLKKGYSFAEISQMLALCHLDIGENVIIEFCIQDQARRLSISENIQLRNKKLEWGEVVQLHSDIENALRFSLKENTDLYLNYQPQINVNSGQVTGAEALIRWRYKNKIINPSEFIPIAEKSDLINLLGEWVIREACREAKKWKKLSLGGDTGIKIAINLSVQQLHPNLPDLVNSILCDTGVDSRLFGIEITESFLLKDNAIPILMALKNSGISLSVDDFGTGYSCLSQLKDLPFDVIKIDRSFVQNIEYEDRSVMMIESIVDLAKKFSMSTLAEGVETKNQVKILKEMGCSICQGFHFSESLASDHFIRFVDQGISDFHM